MYVGSTSLISLSAETGQLERQFNHTTPGESKCQNSYDLSSPVVGSDGNIFIGVNSQNCYSYVFALRPTTRGPPEIEWKLQVTYSVPSVIIGDGQLVYFNEQMAKLWIVSGGQVDSSLPPSAAPSPATTTASKKPSAAPTPSPTTAAKLPSAAPSP